MCNFKDFYELQRAMLHRPWRPMVVFAKKLNSFSGEAAQHGRPLQTPLVSLINFQDFTKNSSIIIWCCNTQ